MAEVQRKIPAGGAGRADRLPAHNRDEQARVPAARSRDRDGEVRPLIRSMKNNGSRAAPLIRLIKNNGPLIGSMKKQWIAAPQVVLRGNSGLAAHR